jgi:hypothetical protein
MGARDQGVVTQRSFSKDDVVVDYNGLKLSGPEDCAYIRRTDKDKDTDTSYLYMFKHKGIDWIVDPGDMHKYGHLKGRYVNHSKPHPNVSTKIYLIDDQPHLMLVVKHDIPDGTELLFDYGDRRPGIPDWLGSKLCPCSLCEGKRSTKPSTSVANDKFEEQYTGCFVSICCNVSNPTQNDDDDDSDDDMLLSVIKEKCVKHKKRL